MLGNVSGKVTDGGGFCKGSSGELSEINAEAALSVTSSVRARASAVAASLSSPTKAGRAMSKKQQKLAEAAKTSRNISQFFTKKQTTEKSQEEVEKGLDATSSHTAIAAPQENSSQQAHSLVTGETVEVSPVVSEARGVNEEENKTEGIITIPNEDEEEGGTHKTHRPEMEQVQDTHKEYESTTE